MALAMKTAYYRMRQPMAYLLVVVAVGLNWLPVPGLQVAALTALALILMQLLFEVHDAASAIPSPRSFLDFFAAQPLMREYIQRSLDRNAQVSIKGLGVTMQHAWPLLETMLLPVLDNGRVRNVHVELAVLDPEWPDLNRLNASWKTRIQGNVDSISLAQSILSTRLKDKSWRLELYKYRHMPNWHGFMIDEQYLFMGTCVWRDGVLTGGENRYELFEVSDQFGGTERIRQFNIWFEYCKNNYS